MTTIRQVITSSLRKINVIQANEVPTDDDINNGLYSMNSMLDSWSTEKLSIFLAKQYYFWVRALKQDYTLGAGGDWDIPRPMNIQRATLSYGGSLTLQMDGTYTLDTTPTVLDIPMESLTDAQWASIPVKTQQSTYPIKFYNNGNYPSNTVTVWPSPTTDQPITLWLWQPLADYDSLDLPLVFPKGYERAITYNLAIEIASEYGSDVPDSVMAIATQSKGFIKRLNSRPQIMIGDSALSDSSSSIYNYNLSTTVPN